MTLLKKHAASRFNTLWMLALIFLLSFFSGCQQSEVVSQLRNEPYFDLKGLLDRQIDILDSLDPSVEINALIGKEKESITTHKDSSAWRTSLKLFMDADINQPVLQGRYAVKDSFDQQRGLKVKVYEGLQQDGLDIPYLKVYYKDSLADVRYIETMFQEENLLYTTQRFMSATFDPFNRLPRITHYKILGKQKMLFKDSIQYEMNAQINYKL